jgi:magnesium-transporting ATPase (P-type)
VSLRGAMGTPAVLIAITAIVIGQLAFTYLPFMNETFGTRPLSLADGAMLIGIGILMFLFLEVEKLLIPKLGWFEELRC